jgi:acetolactate synthase-1/2/3 large subunit
MFARCLKIQCHEEFRMSEGNQKEKGSVVLAKMLSGYGLTHLFYVEQMLRRTMIELEKTGIRRVVTHSEKAAAYMADGYARAGRRPSVCMAQSVGAANLASGLQDAYLARSPVIALTGAHGTGFRYRNAYQEVENHWPFFEPVTKYNATVSSTAELPHAIRQAFREAVTGIPRPVHLDIVNNTGATVDLGETECTVYAEPRFTKVPPFRPAPDPSDVKAAITLIYEAQKPMIVVGGGAQISDAGAEILELVNRLNIPLATSADGKGIIPENHPLCLGCIGGYGRVGANALVKEADLILYIGCKICDQISLDWTLPAPGVKIIQIDLNPAELGRNYPNAASVLGDAKVSVAALLTEATRKHSNAAWSERIIGGMKKWHEKIDVPCASESTPIYGERLCRELQNVLPDNAILVSDTGWSSCWPSILIELTKQTQRFIRAAGGSLGWAFPASLGAKCACPDRPVICFAGDGALWYHFSELETQVRHNISSVTVLNNNYGYGQSRRGIVDLYADKPGHKEDLFAFTKVDFSRIAKEIGLFALRVEKPAEIGPAVSKALASGKPALVEVITDITRDPQVY